MGSSIHTAELGIYVVLIQPIFYILWKHGWVGALGWFYASAFCTIRIVGGAMDLSHNESAGIIASIGLSPLLLALVGILHEARHYLARDYNKKMEWVFSLSLHVVITTGLAILAVGASSLIGDDPKPSDQTLTKIGVVLLFVSWLAIVAGASFTLVTARSNSSPTYRSGFRLLVAVCIACVFVGIRTIYALIAFVTGSKMLNPQTGSLAIRVVLAFLPELITTIIFIAVGIWTRNARYMSRQKGASRRAYNLTTVSEQ